jgi:hypothetical protein
MSTRRALALLFPLAVIAVALVACDPAPGWPTSSSAGWQHTGVTLTPYTGPLTITQDGTTIDSADIAGCLTIEANDVTISRSRITGGDCARGVWLSPVGGNHHDLTLTDVEITSAGHDDDTPPNEIDTAIDMNGTSDHTQHSGTLTRVYVHNTRQGIVMGIGLSVQDSIVMGMYKKANPLEHAWAISSQGGLSNILLHHNVFECGKDDLQCAGSLALFTNTQLGGGNNGVTVTDNYFETNGPFCLNLGFTPTTGGSQPNVNLTFTGNLFATYDAPTCGTSGADSYAGLTSTIYQSQFVQPVDQTSWAAVHTFDVAHFNDGAGNGTAPGAVYSGGWGNTWGDHGPNAGALNVWYDKSGPPGPGGAETSGPLDGQTVLP